MKNTLVLAVLFTTHLFGQTYLEQRTFVSEGRAVARVNGLVTGNITKKLGGFTWFQVQKGYSEAYGGPTYSPKPWLQLAIGVGIEEAKNPLRSGGFVWLGNSKSSVLFIPEYGGSGFWWKLEANHKLTKSFGVGFLTERFKGSGLRFEVNVPHTPLKLWAAPMSEKERTNLLFGIRWNW